MSKAAILLLPAGVIAYALLSKAKGLKNANFYPDSVHSLDMSNGTVYMNVGVLVQNTSTQKIVIRSIAGNVNANGYLVGNASNFSPYALNPNSQGVMYIQIRFGALGIVQDIVNAFQTKNFTQLLSFDGFANIDGYQVPVSLTYKIGLQ